MAAGTAPKCASAVRPLAGEVLLAAWERGSTQQQPARALTLLLAGRPDLREPDAAAMTVAERDLALLDLRRHSFGPMLAAFFVCPSCGHTL